MVLSMNISEGYFRFVNERFNEFNNVKQFWNLFSFYIFSLYDISIKIIKMFIILIALWGGISYKIFNCNDYSSWI